MRYPNVFGYMADVVIESAHVEVDYNNPEDRIKHVGRPAVNCFTMHILWGEERGSDNRFTTVCDLQRMIDDLNAEIEKFPVGDARIDEFKEAVKVLEDRNEKVMKHLYVITKLEATRKELIRDGKEPESLEYHNATFVLSGSKIIDKSKYNNFENVIRSMQKTIAVYMKHTGETIPDIKVKEYTEAGEILANYNQE